MRGSICLAHAHQNKPWNQQLFADNSVMRAISPVERRMANQCRASQLRVRSMNFGQHWRTPGVLDVSYSVTIPMAFVAYLLKRELPDRFQDVWFLVGTHWKLSSAAISWPEAEQILNSPGLVHLPSLGSPTIAFLSGWAMVSWREHRGLCSTRSNFRSDKGDSAVHWHLATGWAAGSIPRHVAAVAVGPTPCH